MLIRSHLFINHFIFLFLHFSFCTPSFFTSLTLLLMFENTELFQFSSVAQSCPTLCNPMNRSMPGLPVHHQFPESPKPMSIESVMPSSHLTLCRPLLLLPQSFPALGSFQTSQLFACGGQSFGASSTSVLPVNTQD